VCCCSERGYSLQQRTTLWHTLSHCNNSLQQHTRLSDALLLSAITHSNNTHYPLTLSLSLQQLTATTHTTLWHTPSQCNYTHYPLTLSLSLQQLTATTHTTLWKFPVPLLKVRELGSWVAFDLLPWFLKCQIYSDFTYSTLPFEKIDGSCSRFVHCHHVSKVNSVISLCSKFRFWRIFSELQVRVHVECHVLSGAGLHVKHCNTHCSNTLQHALQQHTRAECVEVLGYT